MLYICLRSCVLFYDANTFLNISKNKYVPADPELGLVLGFRFERIRCRRCFMVPFSCIEFKVCGLVELGDLLSWVYDLWFEVQWGSGFEGLCFVI